MGNLYPPPPKSRMGKWLVLAFAVFVLELGGGGGGDGGRGGRMGFYVPLYSFQDGSLRNK